MTALQRARNFSRLALDCVQRELPNHIAHLINDEGDVKRPRELHPAFYGCLDWHSAVHGHWMLVRLLRTVPGLPEAAEICAALDANLAAEVAYFAGPCRASYERMYGWAWLLQLAAELHGWDGWDDDGGRRWSAHLEPLTARSSRATSPSSPSRPTRSGPASTPTPRSASPSTTRARPATARISDPESAGALVLRSAPPR